MPSGMAALVRHAMTLEKPLDTELERSTKSKTGYVNVIMVGKYYQARLQV